MQIHHFYKSNFASAAHALTEHTLHGCDSFAVFQQSHPGKFIALPDNFEPCKPGFRPYQKDDGKIVGLKLD